MSPPPGRGGLDLGLLAPPPPFPFRPPLSDCGGGGRPEEGEDEEGGEEEGEEEGAGEGEEEGTPGSPAEHRAAV